MTTQLAPLPSTFAATRESMRALACFVLAPAARRLNGHIWLVPDDRGIATPDAAAGRVRVAGDQLVDVGGAAVGLTTLRRAAAHCAVELNADPGVGEAVPPLRPDEPLDVDPAAVEVLGAWYRFGADALDVLGAHTDAAFDVSDAKLWPEHFDLALTMDGGAGRQANVGISPGDTYSDEPYAYVGPWDPSALTAPIWNAPFGATLGYAALRAEIDPAAALSAFFDHALAELVTA